MSHYLAHQDQEQHGSIAKGAIGNSVIASTKIFSNTYICQPNDTNSTEGNIFTGFSRLKWIRKYAYVLIILFISSSSQKLSYPITNGKETNNKMILQTTAH